MAGVAIVWIYIGFAIVQGNLFAWGRLRGGWLPWLYTSLVLLPASFGLPGTMFQQALSWLVGLMVVFVFALRPRLAPAFLWRPLFIPAYFSTAMLLVLAWALQSAHPPLEWWIGGPALLAALFSAYQVIHGVTIGRGAV